MVQKEVKRKAQVYGLMAILLASMFVALIYSYGTQPGVTQPNGQPSPSANPVTEITPMKTFASYDDLKNFLTTNSPSNSRSFYTASTSQGSFSDNPAPMPTVVPSAAPAPAVPSEAATGGTTDYSTTNIQVAGVDEADTVKTDGKYLYVIANNSVYILNAGPQDARVLAKLTYQNTYLSGIYLSQDGNKLAVLGDQYVPYDYSYGKSLPPMGADIALYPYFRSGTTFAYVYDVANKNSPQLVRNFTMSGNYFNSRMIGNYVYNIVTENAYVYNDTVFLPSIYNGAQGSEISANSVYYSGFANPNYGYQSYTYTTFVALNIMNDAQAPSNMTIMLDGANTVYVSTSNIYVTYPVYEYEDLPTPTPFPTTSGSNITIMPMPPVFFAPSSIKTSIYRIHVAESSMVFAAQGNVSGTVLNQYAMDENNGYFRIATTVYQNSFAPVFIGGSSTSQQQNNVYVLDLNLNTVGKLENLGTGENFHAARFIGNRCYLVTFMKTDPLFVIDLSQPNNPKVLGQLVIPGYSDYLHPYDETHLIGLGKDAVETDNGFAWYQGLKLSLFDVSDVSAPKEIAKVIIGDRGTSSEALSDPKAFLFDQSKNLLVIPVELYLINGTQTAVNPPTSPVPLPATLPGIGIAPAPMPTPGFNSGPSAYGTFVWQGAYVFKVTLNGGFEVRGNVTQLDSNTLAKMAQNGGYYYYGSNDYWITRTLYIGNVLYTISNGRVQLNSLDNFALIAQVDLK